MESIKRKSLLYKTDVEYGDYTINYVLGCSHGCLYPCYAFNIKKRFGIVKDYDIWRNPKLVLNAIELLNNELPKLKHKIKSVQLSFTTEPFMKGFSEVTKLTLQIINRLNQDDIKVITLTKGVIPEETLSTKKINEFGITLISLDKSFKDKYEPFASDYEERSLKKAHEAGYKTWVSIELYPTPNIIKQDLKTFWMQLSFVGKAAAKISMSIEATSALS